MCLYRTLEISLSMHILNSFLRRSPFFIHLYFFSETEKDISHVGLTESINLILFYSRENAASIRIKREFLYFLHKYLEKKLT